MKMLRRFCCSNILDKCNMICISCQKLLDIYFMDNQKNFRTYVPNKILLHLSTKALLTGLASQISHRAGCSTKRKEQIVLMEECIRYANGKKNARLKIIRIYDIAWNFSSAVRNPIFSHERKSVKFDEIHIHKKSKRKLGLTRSVPRHKNCPVGWCRAAAPIWYASNGVSCWSQNY